VAPSETTADEFNLLAELICGGGKADLSAMPMALNLFPDLPFASSGGSNQAKKEAVEDNIIHIELKGQNQQMKGLMAEMGKVSIDDGEGYTGDDLADLMDDL